MKTKFISAILWATLSILSSKAQHNTTQVAFEKTNKQYFIENKGQWHSDVLYLCRMDGMDAWITKYGINYNFYKLEEKPSDNKTEYSLPDKFEYNQLRKAGNENIIIGHRVLMKLQNYNPNSAREGKQKQEGYYNYFIGNDASKHATNVGLYKEAVVKNLYPGIDVRYYFDRGSLRYDYIVHPGADPSQIKFHIVGSDYTYINNSGNLVFTTRFGEVLLAELASYQPENGNKVDSKFRQDEGDMWSISLGNYDRSRELVIDPLVYSTYLGGGIQDYGNSITVDSSGNTYVTGSTYSTNYDVTTGAYQTEKNGDKEIFVSKLNYSGAELLYSTYLGGNDEEAGTSITIDDVGNTFITGYTRSTDYYATSGTLQAENSGLSDVFITQLNPSGTALNYSTYFGGNGNDYGYGIAVDDSGYVYITGSTFSNNLYVTVDAYQTEHAGYIYYSDVFVMKLNTSGTALSYSTYLGGSAEDVGTSITIDDIGNTYITGYTTSTNFDTTTGVFQTTLSGSTDVFVTKLNASGTALGYSTYLGGSFDDYCYSIAVDNSGNAYVTGYTFSTDFDVSTGAYKTTLQGSLDVFITKLNTLGTALIYSSYFGASDIDFAYSIAVDDSWNAYITGYTSSTDFDVTLDAYQTTLAGLTDVFITKFNESGSALIYSTYLGGSGYDVGYSITLDGSFNAYITGYSYSTDFVITSGTYQTEKHGANDVIVTKLCIGNVNNILLSSDSGTNNQTVCVNTAIVDITYATTGGVEAYISGLPEGVTYSTSGGLITISGAPSVSGSFMYTITPAEGCWDSSATGTIVAETCSVIESVVSACSWVMYPNPNNGTFYIQTEYNGMFDLIDFTGKVHRRYVIDNNKAYIIENLPAGMYFIRELNTGKVRKLTIL